jgi:hypothetical protein
MLNFGETLHKVAVPVVGCAVGVLLATSPVRAATVEIDNLLTNPSFETGDCTGWTCTNGSVYVPTTTQYTPGADGLSGGRLVPDGTHAAFMPSNGIAGSGNIQQSTSTKWVAGNNYTFSFFVGLPKTDDIFRPQSTLQVYFLEDGVVDGLPTYNITAPLPGQWQSYQFAVSAAQLAASGATGHNIGVEWFFGSGNGNQPLQVDFDIATPLPAALPLFGGGLGLMGFLVRRKQKASAGMAAA